MSADAPVVVAQSVDETASVQTLQQQLRLALNAIEVLVGQSGRMESGISKLVRMQGQLETRFDELRAEISETQKRPSSAATHLMGAGRLRKKTSNCGSLPDPDRDNYLHSALNGTSSQAQSPPVFRRKHFGSERSHSRAGSRRAVSSRADLSDEETHVPTLPANANAEEPTTTTASEPVTLPAPLRSSMRSHLKPSLRAAESKGSTPRFRRLEDAEAGTVEGKPCSIGFVGLPDDNEDENERERLLKARRPSVPEVRSAQVLDFLAKNQEVVKTLMQLKEQHRHKEQRTQHYLDWIQANKHKCWFHLIIPHYHPYRQVWDLVLFGLVLVSVYLVPMQIAFDFTSTFWVVLGWCFDAAFSLDVVLNFFTTYDHDGVTVFQFKRIAINYLRSWFVIDVVSVIPIDQLVSGGNSSVGRLNKLIRLVRMFKLLRVFRLYRLTKAGAISRFLDRASPSTLRLAMVVVITFTVLHILACFYWMIVEIEWVFLDTPAERVEVLLSPWFPPRYVVEEAGMLSDGTDMSEVLALLPPEYAYDVNSTAASGFGAAYVWSFFWATSAASGYQDFLPATALQTSFTLFVVIFGFLGSAVILGSVTTALSEMNAISAKHKQKMEEIQQYLRVKEVPKRVRRAIAEFYSFAGAGDSANEDLEDLPANLRLQLDIVLNRSLFLKVPAFRECTPGQICELVPRIVRQYALRSQFIVEQGGEALGLYMIARGTVEVLSDHEHVGMLGRNEFFGEQSIISDTPEENTFKAAEITELMVLFRDDLNEVMELFPELRDTLRKHAIMRDKRRQEASRVLSLWKMKRTVPEVAPEERNAAAPEFLDKWRALVQGGKNTSDSSSITKFKIRSRRASIGPREAPKANIAPFVGGIDGGGDSNGRRTSGRRGRDGFGLPLLVASTHAPPKVMPRSAPAESTGGDKHPADEQDISIPVAMLRWRRRAAEQVKPPKETSSAQPDAAVKVDERAPNGRASAPATEQVVAFRQDSVRVVDVSIS
mmetsp:Transcript_51424/g.111931  ORF Transcript_51424/g.111931 Transcript_51424/m.111931 type:complete len:995 (+) Transcript_51424:117-3101(+)